jgi:hypothetical protein
MPKKKREPKTPPAPDRSDERYGREVIASLGAAERRAPLPWRPGVAGTAPDGSRFVVYRRQVRLGGERAWRDSNPGT